MQVIIYKNPNGNNVCVCIPTGEISIEEVQAKDTPEGSIIVDISSIPTDKDFFEACCTRKSWENNYYATIA